MADNAARNYMRAKLRNFDEIKNEVKSFEEALRYPFQETDTNIGGGRSNVVSSPVEKEVIAVMSNTELKQKTRLINVVEYVLGKCNPQIKYMMTLRYKKKFEWEKIAHEMNYTESACRKIDKKILDEMVKLLGY